jgi:hypothetical protein
LLISVGHDEYWSLEMRDNVEAFVRNGGNVAFFSGNTCWWQVRIENEAIVGYRTEAAQDPFNNTDKSRVTTNWYLPPLNRPENSLTGVSYRNGGGWWYKPQREIVGYTVQHADHWVFEGTKLTDGDRFGDGDQEALVGYECDGTSVANQTDSQGFLIPEYTDGTPRGFVILGYGRLDGGWNDGGNGLAATMGLYSGNGIVFTASTSDWARVLGAGNEHVAQITGNVLSRLKSRGVRIIGPLPTVCGFYASVEGQSTQFHVDTKGLPDQSNMHYEWAVTNADGVSQDQPTFRATMPSPPVSVTVTITIHDGTDCPAFGTLTFTPLSTESYLKLEMMCGLRTMVATAATSRAILEGTREGSLFFVDPLWDPLRYGSGAMLSERDLNEIIRDGTRVVGLAERLLDMQRQSNIQPSSGVSGGES